MDYAQSMGVSITKNKLNLHFVRRSIISSRIGSKVVEITIKNELKLNIPQSNGMCAFNSNMVLIEYSMDKHDIVHSIL